MNQGEIFVGVRYYPEYSTIINVDRIAYNNTVIVISLNNNVLLSYRFIITCSKLVKHQIQVQFVI